ncbi:proton-conducting transporter transmembrane domain-containing protein [Legionella clemsonensis]|uniref:Na(+)/H(+) antiporter subunit D n=1 Tax=Legionella clemsonensis TaxID=1867846 RepID=A0A222P1N7_9GAMM|nr:proton-conducting transporter membrane subunit [Legionella clemsonensis]ASQ45750.1 Na(+)/H(+) antiporter subunit D [Legionella clemsonensis]
MNNAWIALYPVLICLVIAILCCITWPWQILQKIVHIVGALLLIVVTSIVFYAVRDSNFLVVQVGNYPAPFGISIVIDHLSAIMLLLTGIIGFSVAIYAIADITRYKQIYGFFPMFWLLMTGICGAFSTGDLFNLYVWFEVMLIASFVLMVIGSSKAQLEGTIKYVALNLVATVLLLVAIAMLYGITGALNMAAIGNGISQLQKAHFVWVIVLMLALAFAIKSALFPLFFWLPASYHTTSVSASAVFAGMLTKVGVYALIRLFTLIYIPEDNSGLLYLLLACAGMTMLTGVLGAAAQFNFRRILSFHIISQVGYMVAGLAIYKPSALIASIFYIVHHVIVKTNLFLVSGVVKKIQGSFNLRRLGNFYEMNPFLAILFLIPAFSLAGIPPLSGFWAKLLILHSALINHHLILLVVALIVSFLTLYSMLKIWTYVFWSDRKEEGPRQYLSFSEKCWLMIPILFLVSLTLLISIFPGFLYQEARLTITQLVNPQYYIRAVLWGS